MWPAERIPEPGTLQLSSDQWLLPGINKSEEAELSAAAPHDSCNSQARLCEYRSNQLS